VHGSPAARQETAAFWNITTANILPACLGSNMKTASMAATRLPSRLVASALRRATVRGVLPPPRDSAGRAPLLLAARMRPCDALMTLAAGLPGSVRSLVENGLP